MCCGFVVQLVVGGYSMLYTNHKSTTKRSKCSLGLSALNRRNGTELAFQFGWLQFSCVQLRSLEFYNSLCDCDMRDKVGFVIFSHSQDCTVVKLLSSFCLFDAMLPRLRKLFSPQIFSTYIAVLLLRTSVEGCTGWTGVKNQTFH